MVIQCQHGYIYIQCPSWLVYIYMECKHNSITPILTPITDMHAYVDPYTTPMYASLCA